MDQPGDVYVAQPNIWVFKKTNIALKTSRSAMDLSGLSPYITPRWLGMPGGMIVSINKQVTYQRIFLNGILN